MIRLMPRWIPAAFQRDIAFSQLWTERKSRCVCGENQPTEGSLQGASRNWLVDPKLLQLVTQRPKRYAELLRRGGLVVAHFLQRLHDRLAFEIADIAVEAYLIRRAGVVIHAFVFAFS